MRASQREKRWGVGWGVLIDAGSGSRGEGGGGRKGTATTMGTGGCSMGVKRSPEVEDGGGDRLIWTASG